MKEQIKIAFFGDSICFGQFVSVHEGWVTRISSHLQKIAADRNRIAYIFNSSINGNTTRMALERMPYDVQSHAPKIILIQFGINDSNYWLTDKGLPRVNKKSFEANLHEIISRVRTFGAVHLMLATNQPVPKTNNFPLTDISHLQSNKEYNDIIRKVAQETKAILIDNEKVWLRNIKSGKAELKDLLLPDNIHLSEQGHELYFETALPFMVKALLKSFR